MIDEVHSAYMNSNNEDAKVRLDAQMKILWSVKDKIENMIADIDNNITDESDENDICTWIYTPNFDFKTSCGKNLEIHGRISDSFKVCPCCEKKLIIRNCWEMTTSLTANE